MNSRLFTAFAALSLFTSPAKAGTTIKLGATVVDFEDVTADIAVDHTSEKGSVQQVYDLDYAYKSGPKQMNRLYALGKINLALGDQLYMVNVVKTQLDQYAPDQLVGATGLGYKILRTDTVKVSNEVTGGIMLVGPDTKPVVRNSLWARFNSGPYSLSNKMLTEYTGNTYLRNETELGYRLDKRLTVGLRNILIRSPETKSNVTLVTLGLTL